MSFKPLILLFFAWLVWGGFAAQNILSQNQKNQTQIADQQFKSEGQMLDWFFQERTLQLRSMQDDEPVMSRYTLDDWKSLQPWKGVVFLKGAESHLYGVFDKVMPEAHRKQLIEKVKSMKPQNNRFEGVHWESFQWNGTPFVLGYISRGYGTQAFIAQGEDWGRSLSIIPSDNTWIIANQAGRILFHPDVRYVGQKKPVVSSDGERDRDLASTNLVAYLTIGKSTSSKSLYFQLALITLGLALISSVLISQLMKKERSENERKMEAFRTQVAAEAEARAQALPAVQEVPLLSQEHLLKDLSHRVSSSLGRQLEPALINILGQAQWMLSLSMGNPDKRSTEENAALETIVREVRSSKSMLDKLLAVAGERKIDLFPMKLETPLRRVFKRWETELENQTVFIEKEIEDTSFFPINSEALEKALSHLIQNSLEAMSRRLDKKISIVLKDEGDTLLLVFEDNGVGIEPHHLNLIGDAFFTTKSQTKHLGLGLTEAFGIFKQHHAIVTVVSEVGKFTRFEIRFDKNEAQNLVRKQEANRARVFDDAIITVPENLPRPSEMTKALHFVENQVPPQIIEHDQQHTVDEEIEKLLELGEMDFVEETKSDDSEETIIAASETTEIENFIDINPDTMSEEDDEFQMKQTVRRDLDV